MSFTEAYESGTITHAAKRIYDVVREHNVLPLQAIKAMAGFAKEDKSSFDRALTELQMRMFLTMCGKYQGKSWPSTVFCTTEEFFDESVFAQAAGMSREDAERAITAQVLRLNPDAQAKKIKKFIFG
jgi:hypothetical protein